MVEELQIAFATHTNAAFAVGRGAYTSTDAHSVTKRDMAAGSVIPTRRNATREALQMNRSRKRYEDKIGRWQHLQILDIEGIGNDNVFDSLVCGDRVSLQ